MLTSPVCLLLDDKYIPGRVIKCNFKIQYGRKGAQLFLLEFAPYKLKQNNWLHLNWELKIILYTYRIDLGVKFLKNFFIINNLFGVDFCKEFFYLELW